MKLALVVTAALATCAPTTAQHLASLTGAPGPNAAGEWDPRDFGAAPTPDGQPMLDARPGIQAAIEAAGDRATVKLDCGTWRVSRAPVGSADRFASVYLHGKHVTLAGAGPCTVLAPTGDAKQGDWRGVDVSNAADVTVRDLTVDTSWLTNTEEQTHAVQATGPVDGLRLERVTFVHPRRTTDRVGDCLRLLGNPGALVERVSVVDVDFALCARSGIGVQRGVFGLQVVGSRFEDVLKTAVDHEPTSAGGNGDEAYVGDLFLDTHVPTPGGAAMSLAGYDDPIARVTVVGCDFRHRGIQLYRAQDVVMTGNVVTCDSVLDMTPCVDVGNLGLRWTLSGNTVRRGAGDGTPATAGPVVHAAHHGTSPGSSHARVSGNMLEQDGAGHVVAMESASSVTVSGNDVTYAWPSTTWASGIAAVWLRATAADLDMAVVDHNVVRSVTPGALSAVVSVAASPKSVGAVVVDGNASAGVDQGVRCQAASGGTFVSPVVVAGNAFVGLGHALAWSCPFPTTQQVP